MAGSTYLPQVALRTSEELEAPRHALFVRVTHWIQAISFIVLLLSGIAILLAHPRLYWGETGAKDGPSLLNLPLPWVLEIPIRGPGRYLHFLFAWVSVGTGLIYVLAGMLTHHFRKNLVPSGREVNPRAIWAVVANHLRFKRSSEKELQTYNVLQRLTYSAVIFFLFPLMIWTGLAMSPAVTSVFPFAVTAFGGQQSARTIHFFVACALVLFLIVHVALVCQTGFKSRMRAMITGRSTGKGAA
ncbi:MAG: cytochrome b/b6 domain-containing protein [Acidobacteria bacterium]|nr:cytochrome b/b6 domain-containing protein [Acidobacteriota bacterium]